MLTFSNVFCRRGEKVILDGVSFTIHAKQHVGLVGANGAGKSSLFALIRGQLLPEDGDVSYADRLRLAHLAQQTPSSERSALDFALDGDRELRRIQGALTKAEENGDSEAIGQLHSELDAINGYAAEARAGAILHGLGFRGQDAQRPVNSFSGGWRMRLALAQTLMTPADLYLLDEPTNHLDLDATLWLEHWLKKLDATLLIISHDRDFLDETVAYVAHLENSAVTLYRGNYSSFERQQSEALALQQQTFVKSQKRMAEIQRFVDRFRAKATKAKQVQSRLRTLEQLAANAAVHARSPFRFAFRNPEKRSNPLVEGEGLSLGYAPEVILEKVRFRIAPGARIGILGPNGAGKSTLLKTLAGELAPLAGTLSFGHHAAVAWFAQHQMSQLKPDAPPLAQLQALDPTAPEQALRNHLGGFGFGTNAMESVAYLSGGEQARLVLALLAWQKPALLLLDEPTNHLDMEMRQALALALADFEGAVVLVSHDRHLLRETADEFWLVADGAVAPWTGDLQDYARWLLERGQGSGPAKARDEDAAHTRAARQEEKRTAAAQRAALAPLRKKIQATERALEAAEAELASLEAQLADPALYDDPKQKDQVSALMQRAGQARQDREALEGEWLALSEEYEALGG